MFFTMFIYETLKKNTEAHSDYIFTVAGDTNTRVGMIGMLVIVEILLYIFSVEPAETRRIYQKYMEYKYEIDFEAKKENEEKFQTMKNDHFKL